MIQIDLIDYGERFSTGRYKLLNFDYAEAYVILFDNIDNCKYKATYNKDIHKMELEEWQE